MLKNVYHSNIAIFLVLIILITSVFWLTDVDIQAARLFYHPQADDTWFEGEQPLWMFFYQLGPVISIIIAIGSLITIFLSGLKTRWNHLRIKAVFVLVCFLVGPGLLVNALLKENWGRSRPAQVAELGGVEAYVPPLMYSSKTDGESFPSGHSSVGFALIAFFYVFRRKHFNVARGFFVGSLLMGFLLGSARMAAGGHFVSDILWSLFITYLTTMGLYQLFKKKLDNNAESVENSSKLNVLYSGIAFIVLAYGVFNWPVKQDENKVIIIDKYDAVVIVAKPLNVIFEPSNLVAGLNIEKYVRGFGLPRSGLVLKESVDEKTNTLYVTIEKKGYLTEIEGNLTLSAPAASLKKIRKSP